MPPRLFLLSPASLNGLRAKQLTSPRAQFALAARYRTEEGVEIGDAFAFMSALYFRGKIAYARRFAQPAPAIGGDGIFVITPGYGLVPPDWRINEERMKRMRKIDIDVATRTYTKPLREHADLIARALDAEGSDPRSCSSAASPPASTSTSSAPSSAIACASRNTSPASATWPAAG